MARIQFATGALFLLILGMVVFLSTGPPFSNLLLKVGISVVLGVVLDICLVEIFSPPRELVLRPDGVLLRYRFHHWFRSWTDVRPAIRPRPGLFHDGLFEWVISYRPGQGTPKRGMRVFAIALTRPQAQALSNYPSGLQWDIPSGML